MRKICEIFILVKDYIMKNYYIIFKALFLNCKQFEVSSNIMIQSCMILSKELHVQVCKS